MSTAIQRRPAKLADLTPNESNPRTISDVRLDALRRSLEEFGDLSGYVFNRRTKRLVSGHQREKAMPPDCEITVTHEHKRPTRNGTVRQGYVVHDGERFAYREVDWDGKTEASAMLAANRHGGEWDNDALADMLKAMDKQQRALSGFEEGDTAALLARIAAPAEFERYDENLPVEHKCPKCGYQWSGRPS